MPTVQGISGGRVGGGLMQAPPQGTPEVQVCVGVQVQPGEGEQGASLPTVQGISGGGVE